MIVIAAICIVVLVVIIYLVIKQANQTNDATLCNSQGGICKRYCSEPITYDPDACKSSSRSYCCHPLEGS